MDLYTDSIRDKPMQLLDPNDTDRSQDQDEDKFGPGQRLFEHGDFNEEADMKEFSELLSRVSTKVLWKELMTHQQRMLATAFWEACNYGGKPKPGDFKNVEDKRVYGEWVLMIDHARQVEEAKKRGKLGKTGTS